MSQQQANQQKNWWLGLISLALTVTIAIFFNSELTRYDQNAPYEMGTAIGRALFPAILFCFLFYKLRKKWRRGFFEFFTFCFFLCFCFHSFRELHFLEKDRHHFANFESELPLIVQRHSNTDSGDQLFFGFSKEKFGQYTGVLYMFNSLIEYNAKISDQFMFANEALCDVIDNLFNDWRYTSYAEPRSLLISGQDTLNSFLCNSSNFRASLLNKLKGLKMDKLQIKKAFLISFSNSFDSLEKSTQNFASLYSKVCISASELIDFISEESKNVIVVNGVERFESDFDQDLFQMANDKLLSDWEKYVVAIEEFEEQLERAQKFFNLSNTDPQNLN